MGLPDTRWSAVLAARDGDQAAFTLLAEKYRPAVVNYIARRSDLGVEAEDVAQEVFLALSEWALARIDPAKGRFRSFLFRLTRWVAANYQAYLNARKRGGAATLLPLDELRVADARTDEDFDWEWMASLMALALKRLETEYPRYHGPVAKLVEQGGSPNYAQIAADLEMSPNDVRNAIYRGRKKLTQFVQGEIQSYCTSRRDYEEELSYLSRFLP